MKKFIITCDIGGTKCAAGLVEYDTNSQDLTYKKSFKVKLKEASSLTHLLQQIEGGLELSFSQADAICIGGAGQYDGEFLTKLIPYPYPMNFAKIAKDQKWPPFAIIHDYSPILCATFTSYMDNPANIKRLNQTPLNKFGRRVALGVGTGIGMKDGVLLPSGEFWLGKNEVGHLGVTSPPNVSAQKMQLHSELMLFLQKQHVSVTFEKILSGPGTVNLYEFFYPNREKISPEAVGIAMREGRAFELNNAFAWYLGLFIGGVQLAFMPEGGIWITGGVALSHLDVFDLEDFYLGINASPAYAEERSHFPLGILLNSHHSIMGGGYYAAMRLIKCLPSAGRDIKSRPLACHSAK